MSEAVLPRVAPSGVAVAMLARSPGVAGKTRLTAGLDAPAATALRAALLLDAIEAAAAPGWPLHVFIDPPGDVDLVSAMLAADAGIAVAAWRCQLHGQGAGDLGQRMSDAMARTFGAGHERVVLIGSDLPNLPAQVLEEAARAVDERPAVAGAPRLVLGPAHDGGFYLVAARHVESAAFEGVAWSQSSVLEDVSARARSAGRDVVLVTPWRDVDTPADLRALMHTGGAPRTRALAGAWPPSAQGD